MNTASPTANAGKCVSCLMVTLPVPARLDFAKRSIRSYCRQTDPDRELVIVMNRGEADTRAALAAHVSGLGRSDIRLHEGPDAATLGTLRNQSVALARGDIICQWDDDDLYHPERIARQRALLLGGDFEAVYIQEVLQLYPQQSRMYLTNWRATEAGGHPGTLMAWKSGALRYPETGETARLGEDLSVALDLIGRGRVGYLRDQPATFVYVSHGANSWDLSHHEMLSRELSISQALLRRREGQIRADLAAVELPPGPIEVVGGNGPAFVLDR
jgi:glycosyltransferase involved in cell wall biosynthesis